MEYKYDWNELTTKGIPKFWRCGGGPLPYQYGFGYWTGQQEDLLCIKDNIDCNKEAQKYLSPICSNRLFAVLGFCLKKLGIIKQEIPGGTHTWW